MKTLRFKIVSMLLVLVIIFTNVTTAFASDFDDFGVGNNPNLDLVGTQNSSIYYNGVQYYYTIYDDSSMEIYPANGTYTIELDAYGNVTIEMTYEVKGNPNLTPVGGITDSTKNYKINELTEDTVNVDELSNDGIVLRTYSEYNAIDKLTPVGSTAVIATSVYFLPILIDILKVMGIIVYAGITYYLMDKALPMIKSDAKLQKPFYRAYLSRKLGVYISFIKISLLTAVSHVARSGNVYTYHQSNALELAQSFGPTNGYEADSLSSRKPGQLYFNHYHPCNVPDRPHIWFGLPV